eukprot:68929_1
MIRCLSTTHMFHRIRSLFILLSIWMIAIISVWNTSLKHSVIHMLYIPSNTNKSDTQRFTNLSPPITPEMNTLIETLIDNITTLKSNQVYRVGNLLLHDGAKWHQDVEEIRNNTQHKWNGTLLHHYLSQLEDSTANFSKAKFRKSIAWYISQHNDTYYPEQNELLMHIRAGDVVEKAWFLKEPFVKIINSTIAKYPNITKVSFLCAFHFGGYVESRSYFYNATAESENKRKLRNVFREIITHFGLDKQIKSYQLISNQDVDRDIIAAVTAPYFYTHRCKSTFSKVLSSINGDGWKRVWHAMENPTDLCWIHPKRLKRHHKRKYKHRRRHKRKHRYLSMRT